MNGQARETVTFENLIALLENAEKGSRKLDLSIWYVLGNDSAETSQMIEILVEEGYSWDQICECLDYDVPAYTTSLDAVIPGENVVFSVKSPKRARWAAMHKTAAGEEFMIWGHSEALARRIAGLKGLRALALSGLGRGVASKLHQGPPRKHTVQNKPARMAAVAKTTTRNSNGKAGNGARHGQAYAQDESTPERAEAAPAEFRQRAPAQADIENQNGEQSAEEWKILF